MELEQLRDSGAYVFIAATGGGAGAQNLLWQVPGASSFLAGAVFPYAQRELEAFIGYEPVKFVSADTAINMAIAAYMRACLSCPEGKTPVGIGATCSVATLRDHRGAHCAWVAVVSGSGKAEIYFDEFDKNGPVARNLDGHAVDKLIVDALLDSASGKGQDAEQLLLSHVFSRPWFRVGGRRELTPTRPELLPGAFNPLHAGHLEISSRDTIFQIALRTPHKPPVTMVEALRRTALINAAGRDVLLDLESTTFLAKARKWPGSRFIVGTDTLERILDPQYGHEVEPMLDEFDDLDTRFDVAERNDDDAESLIAARAPYDRHLFEVLRKGQHSRVSSTQLREKR